MHRPTHRLFLILVVFLSWKTSAMTIRVPDDFSTIQSGLDHAGTGDTVLVADGCYHENLIWPEINGITLHSYTDCNSTQISGSGYGPVIRLDSVQSASISGFTLRDGVPIDSRNGGGVSAYNSEFTISECCIRDNTANDSWGGGGMYVKNGHVTVQSCIFEQNRAGNAAVGSAMAIDNTAAVIQDSFFISNEDPISFSGVLSVEYASPEILRNVFAYNPGSGICLWDGGGVIRDNLFFENAVQGINSFDARSVVIENNLFDGNSVQGIYLYHRYTSSRISGNTVTGSQTGVHIINYESSLEIDHNIITGNGTGIELQYGNPLTVFNNDVWGNTLGFQGLDDPTGMDGNISIDPLFCLGPFGSYFLSQEDAGQDETSPCVDAGSESAIPEDRTTRTDLVPDNGVRDIGYHYPIEAPPGIPTPHPTQTPVPPTPTPPPPTISQTPNPSWTPTPSGTPTAGPFDPRIEILLNSTMFQSGDRFDFDIRIENSSQLVTLHCFVLLDAFGSIWFWPSWTQAIDYETWTIPAVTSAIYPILEFSWPNDAGAADGLRFWAALTSLDWMTIVSLDSEEWGYR